MFTFLSLSFQLNSLVLFIKTTAQHCAESNDRQIFH